MIYCWTWMIFWFGMRALKKQGFDQGWSALFPCFEELFMSACHSDAVSLTQNAPKMNYHINLHHYRSVLDLYSLRYYQSIGPVVLVVISHLLSFLDIFLHTSVPSINVHMAYTCIAYPVHISCVKHHLLGQITSVLSRSENASQHLHFVTTPAPFAQCWSCWSLESQNTARFAYFVRFQSACQLGHVVGFRIPSDPRAS